LSVLGQSYTHLEYLVIDGGSSDGTLDIIKKYSGRIDYWLSEPDKGIYQAMNKGVKMAKGDWIHILNSDDFYFSNESLEKAIALIGGAQNKFFYFTMAKDYWDGTRDFQQYPFNWLNKMRLYYSAYIPHPTLFISRQQYVAVGFYDESFKLAADHDFILRLCKKYHGQFIDMPLVVMKQGGASSENNLKTFEEFKRVTIKHNLPAWLAEIIFRFKVFKLRFTKKL
jgi:glycosyltransferase involved in cell wall biosynthesis